MGNARSESSLGILTGDMRGRTSGSFYGRERTGQKMDRKKQEKSQARRDSDGTLRGSVHGSQGSAEGASSETGNSNATEAGEQPIQEKTGRLGSKEVKPKRYSPPNCSQCTALRPTPESNYVNVYKTIHEAGCIVRYCKCGYCPNTFKDVQKVVSLPQQ